MSPMVRWRTERMVITARSILTSNASSSPRRMVSVMPEPTLPRIFSTASDRVRPSTASPSRWLIRSFGCSPALAAGVSSIGDTTLTRPFSMVTSMPSPPNSPRVCTCMSR